MNRRHRIAALGAILLAAMAVSAQAPVIPSTAEVPDRSHITWTLPKDIQWKPSGLGQLQAPLFGDPDKPGPYGVLIKWLPGHMSRPHFHSTDRWAYVAKGTWWTSSSEKYDPATAYPLPEGSFATDLAGKVHWDGAKDEEAIIVLFGIGPVVTTRLPG